MAEPIHYGAPYTLTANAVPDWLANGSSRYGVIGDAWKVSALSSVVRGIRFNPGIGWSDGILTEYDETNVPAPMELPVNAQARWYMIVSRVNWQEPLTRTFVAIPSTNSSMALPVQSAEFKRDPGTIADFPVALVMVPQNSMNVSTIIDLRVWRGDAGWLMANSELVEQYLDRPGTVVEVNGKLRRKRLDGLWETVGHTDAGTPMIFRSLVMDGEMLLPNNTYTTIWNMRGHSSDRTEGITFSGGVGTINVPGLYELTGQVTFPGGDTGLRAVSFTVDPTGQKYLHRTYGQGTGASSLTVQAFHTQYFNAGTKVSLQAWQGTGKGMTLGSSADGTRWHIRRVDR